MKVLIDPVQTRKKDLGQWPLETDGREISLFDVKVGRSRGTSQPRRRIRKLEAQFWLGGWDKIAAKL